MSQLWNALDAFYDEPDPGPDTLERYQRQYPQHREALADLAAIRRNSGNHQRWFPGGPQQDDQS